MVSWLVFAYIALAFVTGIKGLIDGEIASGFAGLIAPVITLIGGAGILSAKRGVASMNLGTTIVGFLMLAGGCFWLWYVDWSVVLHTLVVPGYILALIGFVLGLVYGVSGRQEDRI